MKKIEAIIRKTVFEEVKEALDGIPFNNNDVIKMLREMIEENLKEIDANE